LFFAFIAKMVGQFFEDIKVLLHDLKTSWYFRVWAVLWFVCALMTFIALIILGARSTESREERPLRFWTEHMPSMTFPNYHLRLVDPNQQFTSVYCYRTGGLLLQTSACSYGGPINQCVQIPASSITVTSTPGQRADATDIICQLNTTSVALTDNVMVAWELEPQPQYVGDITYISPNGWAVVELSKEIFRHRDGDRVDWFKRLYYQSTVNIPGYYTISTAIRTFRVGHFEEGEGFDGWMAMGDVGGFAFFLLILHKIVMLGIGIFLVNDSKFLTGNYGDAASAERLPLNR